MENQKTDAERAERLYGPGNLGSDAAAPSAIHAVVHGDFLDSERMAALAHDDRQVADAIAEAGKEIVGVLADYDFSQGAVRRFVQRVKETHLHPPSDESPEAAQAREFEAFERLRVERQWQGETTTRIAEARALLDHIRARAPRFAAYLQNTGVDTDPEMLSLLSEIGQHRSRGRR